MAEILSPLQQLAKKQKLPTVQELLHKSLKTTGITFLARSLEVEYTNLSGVVKGTRKLPVNPTILLARLHGFSDEQGVFMHAYQYLYPDEKPIKPATQKSALPTRKKPTKA
jgi:hypothetical protein